jgi:hypothetical protein
MMVTKVIRYTTTPEAADENERLVRAVFAELAETKPDGLHYATFRLDDGVSFVHVAQHDDEQNPLTSSSAFAQFQSGIRDRVVAGPVPADATVIGSYRLFRSDRRLTGLTDRTARAGRH